MGNDVFYSQQQILRAGEELVSIINSWVNDEEKKKNVMSLLKMAIKLNKRDSNNTTSKATKLF
jgi:hypothetical protein